MHLPRSLLTGAVVALGVACAASGPKAPEQRSIRTVPGFGSESDGLDEVWARYAMARIEGPITREVATGSPDPPPFEQEVFAREFMVWVWNELSEERGYSNVYLSELALIQEEGFMREYTWHCLHVLRGLEPEGLRLAEFREWLAAELPDHRVETWVRAVSTGEQTVFEVGRRAHEPYVCGAPRCGSVVVGTAEQ